MSTNLATDIQKKCFETKLLPNVFWNAILMTEIPSFYLLYIIAKFYFRKEHLISGRMLLVF